jgi:serine/threonine protein kinase
MLSQQEFQQRYRYDTTEDRLGEGGFGEVFKAYDTFLDRWVAIKVSKVKADFPELRLRKEAELVNKLPIHPNIARYEECYSFNTMSGEYDFGVLQYYEHGNLLQLLRKQSLSQGQRYTLLTNLLEGIKFIHSHNIIHRDIKPQNILIVKRNEEYIPKITDFGISKKIKLTKQTQFSNSLIGAGTIAYSAPEQLADQPIRKNTDLWSFGIIAYQVLVGELPFNSGSHSTSSELGRQEILKQINSGQLPKKFDSIPGPWRILIERCLVNDPECRIKDTNECFSILTGMKHPNSLPIVLDSNTNVEDDCTQVINTTSKKVKQKKIFKNWNRSLTYLSLSLLGVIVLAFILLFPGVSENITNNEINLNDSSSISKSVIENSQKHSPEKQVAPIVTQDSNKQVSELTTIRNEKSAGEPEKEIVSNQIQEIVFPNGDSYIGSIKNGKMDGKGKYLFKSGGLISKNDPMERKAEAGDYIEGEWVEGELYRGHIFDRNGSKKQQIIIGRN